MAFPLDSAPETAEIGLGIEGEEAEEEAKAPRKAREPGEPTDEERRRHETTHLPFRSWCPYCVRGRLANRPHRDLGPSGQLGGGPRGGDGLLIPVQGGGPRASRCW